MPNFANLELFDIILCAVGFAVGALVFGIIMFFAGLNIEKRLPKL